MVREVAAAAGPAVELSEVDVTHRGCRRRHTKSTTRAGSSYCVHGRGEVGTATVADVNRPWRSTDAGRRFALIAATALGMASCGTTELDVDTTFDGTWSVAALASDAGAVDLAGQPIEIEIDTGEAAVRGRTTCQALFGSYTLGLDDEEDTEAGGEASFTIPSPEASADCEPMARSVHIDVVDALESVTQWRREGPTLTLSSPSGSLIVLEGQTPAE